MYHIKMKTEYLSKLNGEVSPPDLRID